MIYLTMSLLALFVVSFFVKWESNAVPSWGKGIIIALAAIFALFSMVRTVPNGSCGVVDLFGVIQPNALDPGINFVNPFADVINKPTRTQEIKETMITPSKEGLSCELEVSCFFHVTKEAWPVMMQTVQNGDPLVLLEPNFRSVTRDITTTSEAKALYTADRTILAGKLKTDLATVVGPRGITIEETPMRSLKLPASVSEAINAKATAEQEAQKMEFVLQKEKQEAERKRIEAQGIKDFQKIISESISDKLLAWKGIEATMDIAKSQNAKTVIIGSGKNGLPIILGQ